MAKTKIDKDDIKRLVENTSNPTSTTSVYSAKYVDDNFLKEITKEAIEEVLTGDITSHEHDTYLKLTGGVLSGNVNPSTDNNVILGADTLRYKAIYAARFAGNADTATTADTASTATDATTAVTATNADNATSATKLTNARTINGVSFDGTEDITIPVGHETIQPLSSMLDTLNNLADGIYQLQAPTDTYPDSVCGNIVGTVIPEGTEILRQYTVNAGNQDHKTQIMLIQNETYRRSGIGYAWREWERLITCRDMADYATIDMLETFDGGDLEPDIPVNVYRDTTYHIDGDAKEGKYIIKLIPPFTNPPLEIIETYIAISPESSGEYTIEIQLSDFDIDTRESSSSTTVHSTVYGYAWITIPAGTSVVLLKIYMFENVSRCLIVYTLS